MFEEILELISDAPETATVAWTADFFEITHSTVNHAIKSGNLPATPIRDADDKVLGYNIRPKDALMIWGHRLYKRGA